MINNIARYVLFLPFLMVTACGKQPPAPEMIPIQIATTITRATDSAFETNDAVGLYVVNRTGSASPVLGNNGNHADNVLFSFDGSRWEAYSPVYWQDGNTHADFYCYFPYRSRITNVNSVPVSVRADQREDGYKESELLLGTAKDIAPTQDPVGIVTKHVFSNLLIRVKPGNGYTETSLAADLTRVTIHSTRTSGLLDLSSGFIEPTGETVDITPAGTAGSYRAMVVPQTLENETLLSLEVGGFVHSLKQTITFLPNRQHICTVTVNRTSEGINIGITGWVEDDTDYGGVIN